MASMTTEGLRPRLTVLFDGECPFCRWTVRQVRLLDRGRRLEFVALQVAGLRSDRPELATVAASRALEAALHVVLPDGRVESGGSAILEILFVLPGGFLFRPWPFIPGVPSALERGYRWVADRRSLLAKALHIA